MILGRANARKTNERKTRKDITQIKIDIPSSLSYDGDLLNWSHWCRSRYLIIWFDALR
jgi:hypothetical protein